jgi:hypothetical protein
MIEHGPNQSEDEAAGESVDESRRSFLNVYGKAALVAPPVVTALLATSMSSPAIAKSTGGGGGSGTAVGVALAGSQLGFAAFAPRARQVAAPIEQVLPVAEPAPAPIEIPPPPPPAAPGPERG